MAAKLFGDARKRAVFLHNITDPLDGKVSAVIVEKDMLVKTSWPISKVASQCLGRFLLKVDCSLLVALAVDQHYFFIKVNIFYLKPYQLRNPDAGLEEELQYGVVAAVAESCVE